MSAKAKLSAERIDLAYKALELRAEFDELLKKYGAKMVLGWKGKWVKLQFQFHDIDRDIGVTVVEVTKGRAARYVQQVEENMKEN